LEVDVSGHRQSRPTGCNEEGAKRALIFFGFG
jgi:hypothetical protein